MSGWVLDDFIFVHVKKGENGRKLKRGRQETGRGRDKQEERKKKRKDTKKKSHALKKDQKKKSSLTGNRTRVTAVTGQYTSHYTIRDVRAYLAVLSEGTKREGCIECKVGWEGV